MAVGIDMDKDKLRALPRLIQILGVPVRHKFPGTRLPH